MSDAADSSSRSAAERGARPADPSSPAATARGAPKVLVALGTLFAGFSVVMLCFVVAPAAIDAWQARSWVRTTAVLESVNVVDVDDALRVDARYRFTLDGETYVGTRAALFETADNIGSFQRTLGERLTRAYRRGERVPVWFDPDDPGDAVLDRTVRWGLFAFSGAFALVFGSIGVALVVAGRRPPRATPTVVGADGERPWRERPEWDGRPIRSGARAAAWALGAFGLAWNAVIGSILVSVAGRLHEEPLSARAALLAFGLSGPLVLGLAVRAMLAWRRHGPTPVTLAPFPLALGERALVRVALADGVPADTPVTLTLDAVRYVRRGKHRRVEPLAQRRRETRVRRDADGAFVEIDVDVPDDAPESDAHRLANRHVWYLGVDVPSIGLRRRFEVPVYRDRGHHAGRVPRAIGGERRREEEEAQTLLARTVPIVAGDDGFELGFGPGYGKGSALGGIAFGSVFAVVGGIAALGRGGVAGWLLGMPFASVGIAIVGASLLELGTTRRVRVDHRGIELRTRRFGRASRPCRLDAAALERVDVEHAGTLSGPGGHRMYFRVVARAGDVRIAVARRVDGEAAARALARAVERALRDGRGKGGASLSASDDPSIDRAA